MSESHQETRHRVRDDRGPNPSLTNTLGSDAFGLYRELSALRSIRRFQQHTCIAPISVMEHSYLVAMLAGVFARQLTAMGVSVQVGVVMELSLWHDAAEAITGDLPHHVKRHRPALHAEWEILEAESFRQLGRLAGLDRYLGDWTEMLAGAGKLEAWVVKIADSAELMLYVCEERIAGNRHLDRAWVRILELMKGPLAAKAREFGSAVSTWHQHLIAQLEVEAETLARTAPRGVWRTVEDEDRV